MNKYIVIIFSLLIASCNSGNSNTNKRISELIPEPDLNLRLEFQKNQADSTFIKTGNSTEYIKIDGQQKPFKITKKDDEEMGFESQYYIYRDSSQSIRAIVEVPFSQSGDWFLEITHYFDKNAQVYAFQKKLNTFHHAETCGEGEAIFVQTVQYFDNRKLIAKLKEIKNAKGKEFKEEDCSYQDIEMPIFYNLKDWSESAKIDFKER